MDTGQLVIDGSILEGGGQVLRIASALSAITTCEVKVVKIRACRSKPGLRPQHRTGLHIIAELCTGKLVGCDVGSSTVTLKPGRVTAKMAVGSTGTAGSCTLLCQGALPCALFAHTTDTHLKTHLSLAGGTDAAMAPVVGFLQHVLIPIINLKLHLEVELELHTRGFFPKGMGQASLTVPPLGSEPLPCFELMDRGRLERIVIHTFASGRAPEGLETSLAQAAEAALRNSSLKEQFEIVCEIKRETGETAVGTGAGLLVVGHTTGGCLFGATAQTLKGLISNKDVETAVKKLVGTLQTDACVDEWLQDQLIVFAALAKGTSLFRCTEPTMHTLTAVAICEQMLPGVAFKVHEPGSVLAGNSGTWVIECAGVGWTK